MKVTNFIWSLDKKQTVPKWGLLTIAMYNPQQWPSTLRYKPRQTDQGCLLLPSVVQRGLEVLCKLIKVLSVTCLWLFSYFLFLPSTQLSLHEKEIHIHMCGLPRWHQGRRHKRWEFDPWVRKISWKMEWQPTPVFLPGESQGQRSLAGYSP